MKSKTITQADANIPLNSVVCFAWCVCLYNVCICVCIFPTFIFFDLNLFAMLNWMFQCSMLNSTAHTHTHKHFQSFVDTFSSVYKCSMHRPPSDESVHITEIANFFAKSKAYLAIWIFSRKKNASAISTDSYLQSVCLLNTLYIRSSLHSFIHLFAV